MNKMNAILVLMPADASAGPGLHRAMAWTRRSGAVLHLNLFAHYEPIDYAGTVFGEEVADRARRDFIKERMDKLTVLAAGLAAQGLQVECEVIWAREPARAIVTRCHALRPDLVIKDAGVRDDGSGRLHPSALDWKLLRLLSVPLMLIHPEARVDVRNVLAAIDVGVPGMAGQINERIFEAARGCLLGATDSLQIASVFSCQPMPGYDAGFVSETWTLMDSAHREALQQFAASHGLKSAQTRRSQSVDAASGLARIADDAAADLVVLGSGHHGAIDRLLFGSTAEALIRKLHCDVLLIKPAGFDSPDQLPKRGRRLPLDPASMATPLH